MSHDIYMKVTQQSHNAHGDHVILHNSHMTYLLATMMKNRIPRATYPKLLHTLLKALQVHGVEYNFVSMSLIQIYSGCKDARGLSQRIYKNYEDVKFTHIHTCNTHPWIEAIIGATSL